MFVGESPFPRAVKQVGLDTSAPRFTAMAERLLPQSTPSVGHGGKVGVLHRIWHVFIVWPPFARTVKHAVFGSLGRRIPIVLRFPVEKQPKGVRGHRAPAARKVFSAVLPSQRNN